MRNPTCTERVWEKARLRMSISQQAVAQRQRRERPKPDFIARARVVSETGGAWVTIGAAWALRSGEPGYSLKLTTTPLNWDGRFILLPPLPMEDEVAEATREPDEPVQLPARRKREKEETIPL